jgi:lipoyl(octanoyl) transferase
MRAPILRRLGVVEFMQAFAAMQEFTRSRQHSLEPVADEIWLCEHPAVYTMGVAGRVEHIRAAGDIPVVRTDRGGQVTYHGPGQVVAYALVDLRSLGIFVKEYVYRLEHCMLKTLEGFGVTGHRVSGAPGIYVRLEDAFGHAAVESAPPAERLGVKRTEAFRGLGKIGALGVKVSGRCAYHGLALNVAMDLSPYTRIDPCGYAGLEVVDLARLGIAAKPDAVADYLGAFLSSHLSP